MSSEYADYHAVSKCFDNNLNSACHTAASDSNPYLIFTVNSNIDNIVIYNRYDCCSNRIVGATFSVYDANMELYYESTFATQSSVYNFIIPEPKIPTFYYSYAFVDSFGTAVYSSIHYSKWYLCIL